MVFDVFSFFDAVLLVCAWQAEKRKAAVSSSRNLQEVDVLIGVMMNNFYPISVKMKKVIKKMSSFNWRAVSLSPAIFSGIL